MPAIEEFSSLVATLYEAAADPQQWNRFVVQFYSAMDSTRGVLTATADDPALTKVFLEGYTDSERQDYADYYFQHDEVLRAGLRSILKRSHWTGPLEEIYSYKRLESTEIYNDYYRALDMHYASCVMVGATGPYLALGMAAWRPKEAGPFSPEQLRLVELLTPHLKKAFSLQAQLSAAKMEARMFHAALDAAAVAVTALAADGQILAASLPAEQMMREADVLLRRGGRLIASDPRKNAVLGMLIDRAARVSGVDLVGTGGSSVIPGGSTLLPVPGKIHGYQVQVLPVRATSAGSGRSPAVLVFVADPGTLMRDRSQVLKDLYNLSPHELRLSAQFLRGKELKQAADEMKLTYETTRFHLKQIFRKTNTSRQTELLRLLLAIPA